MRSILVTTVAALALATTSACTGTQTPIAPPSGQITTGAPKPSAPPLAKLETCAAMIKTLEAHTTKTIEISSRMLAAGNDKAAFETAVTDMRLQWASTQVQLEQQASTAADPQVKAAITAFAGEVRKAVDAATAAGTDAAKARDALSSSALVEAQQKATTTCGG